MSPVFACDQFVNNRVLPVNEIKIEINTLALIGQVLQGW